MDAHQQIDRSTQLSRWGVLAAFVCVGATVAMEQRETRPTNEDPAGLSEAAEWQKHLLRAHELRRRGERGTALDEFARFVERYPSSPYVHDAAFWVAQLTWKLEGLDVAIDRMSEAARGGPDAKAWRGAAEVQLRRLTPAR
ncbi:MAG: hypothetical protein AAF658_11070 [Myxococcota bacterium]